MSCSSTESAASSAPIDGFTASEPFTGAVQFPNPDRTVRGPVTSFCSVTFNFRRGGGLEMLRVMNDPEAGGHGGFMGMAPEDQEILAEVRRFADAHWNRETR